MGWWVLIYIYNTVNLPVNGTFFDFYKICSVNPIVSWSEKKKGLPWASGAKLKKWICGKLHLFYISETIMEDYFWREKR